LESQSNKISRSKKKTGEEKTRGTLAMDIATIAELNYFKIVKYNYKLKVNNSVSVCEYLNQNKIFIRLIV